MLTKDSLPQEFRTPRTLIRKARAGDPEQIAAWPAYLSSSRFSGKRMTDFPREPDGLYWWQQFARPERCHYSVILPESGDVIGVYAFVGIDWQRHVVRNMGCFLRADLCFRGYGTETLQPLLSAMLQAGMRIIRLDVDTDNPPAIRCYQKCGMQMVDEIRDGNSHFYEMEVAVQSEQSQVFDSATIEHLLDSDPAIVARHLTSFIETGIVRHPIHAFLYAIASQKNTTYLDLFEHTLLSYDGRYVHEDAMLLTDIFTALMTINSAETRSILSAFRQKLARLEFTPEDVCIGSARAVERLINHCRTYENANRTHDQKG